MCCCAGAPTHNFRQALIQLQRFDGMKAAAHLTIWLISAAAAETTTAFQQTSPLRIAGDSRALVHSIPVRNFNTQHFTGAPCRKQNRRSSSRRKALNAIAMHTDLLQLVHGAGHTASSQAAQQVLVSAGQQCAAVMWGVYQGMMSQTSNCAVQRHVFPVLFLLRPRCHHTNNA